MLTITPLTLGPDMAIVIVSSGKFSLAFNLVTGEMWQVTGADRQYQSNNTTYLLSRAIIDPTERRDLIRILRDSLITGEAAAKPDPAQIEKNPVKKKVKAA